MLALLWLGGTLRLADGDPAPVTGVRAAPGPGRHPAAAQKWQPELRDRWFQRYLDLSLRRPRPAGAIDAVIWPEAASPYPLDREPEAPRLIARVVPPGGLLLTGGERFDLAQRAAAAPGTAWSRSTTAAGSSRIYDKSHLVPFGEYLPFRSVLGRLGLSKLTEGRTDFSAGPGPAHADAARPAALQPPDLLRGDLSGRRRDRPAHARPGC